MIESLREDNFILYCARYYDNPQCHSTEEFLEDLQRIKYIKKLITRYTSTGELKERLILNHIIILHNLFGPDHLARIMYLKLKPQFKYVKPFLLLINALPDVLFRIGDEETVDMNLVPMDEKIVNALRSIRNG